MDQAIYAYPWDVLDDPEAPEQLASLGVGTVSLASVYHTTRAWSPHNPRRSVVDAAHAAVYFRPDPSRYAGLRLQPPTPGWMHGDDSFGEAVAALRDVGLQFNAWTVVTHSSILGRAHPDLVVRNAFSDRYPYALCPADADVRAYASALVGDLLSRYDLDGIELEACGYLGAEHGSHHEKRGLDLDTFHSALLSVCFHPASKAAIAEAGGDPERVRERITEAVRRFFADGATSEGPVAEQMSDLLGGRDAEAVLAARSRTVLGMIDATLAQMPAGDRPQVYLHAHPDRTVSGAAVGADGNGLAERADALVLPLFGRSPAQIGTSVSAASAGVTGRIPVIANLQISPPGVRDEQELGAAVDAALDAGAGGLRYYHYGLAPSWQLAWTARVARRCTG